MEMQNQIYPLAELSKLDEANKHSILLQGIPGCGKTYLANKFAEFKKKRHGFSQFQVVQPKVSSLKELIENSLKLDEIQVICIENLDLGVNAASQVILKYLEEPQSNVYIIITARNDSKLPDTIISRTVQVKVANPTKQDLENYSDYLDSRKHEIAKPYSIYKCCKSLSDVENILNLTVDQLKYYDSIKTAEFWKQSTDQIAWSLSHYSDNTNVNLKFAFSVLWRSNCNAKIRVAALEALQMLETGRVSESAILNKMITDVRYA